MAPTAPAPTPEGDGPGPRLRQDLPANHDRLQSDHRWHPGDQSRTSSLSSYPNDSVGFIRSVHELGLNTKVFGGSPTGPPIDLQSRCRSGSMLGGLITFDWWLPAPKLAAIPGVMDFLKTYQARAARRRRRSARLLSRALGLRRPAGSRRGGRADQEPRPGQDRRLHPHAHLRDPRRRAWPSATRASGRRRGS